MARCSGSTVASVRCVGSASVTQAAQHTEHCYKFPMASQTSSNATSVWIAAVALGVAVLSLLLQWFPAVATEMPTATPATTPGESRQNDSRPMNRVLASPGDWSVLVDRVDQLEARSKASSASNGANRTEAPVRDVAQPNADWVEQVHALEVRVANLEAQQTQAREVAKGLVAPDAITSTLAVLLASRGVVTKVGDIEALQANMATFGQIVADPAAGDWDRIEAYRGMLTFGFESPDQCVAAMPHLASFLMRSDDEKARRSAAGMLQTYKNPSIAATLMAAYQREQVASVRAAIVGSMLQLRDDPGIRQTLESAIAREDDQELVKRIRRALGN